MRKIGRVGQIRGVELLEKFIMEIQNVKPCGRRRLALLGQSIINTKPMLQLDKVSMICPNISTLKDCVNNYQHLLAFSHSKAVVNFAKDGREFDDLEDEDHGGDRGE
jgi:hypothetical protein